MALVGPTAGAVHPSRILPSRTTIPKALSGHLEAVFLGDSIGAGVTFGPSDDPAGDGTDGLRYGGATVPAAATVRNTVDGSTWNTEATYTTSAGAAPLNPGYVPHLVEWALANGYSSIRVSRYAVPSASTATTRATFFDAMWKLLRVEGTVPNLAVLPVTTNDINDAGQVAALGAMLPNFYAEIEWAWPGVRIVHVEPVATNSDKPEADAGRAHIRSTVALRATRSYVAGGQGGVHPTLALYRSGGLAIGPAFQGAA